MYRYWWALAALTLAGIAGADDSSHSVTDYTEVAAAINETMRARHYNPAELDTPEYRRTEAALDQLAATSESDEAFLQGFGELWQDGPFSHVQLNRAQQSAEDLANYLDTLRIGGGGATLAWVDDVAILTVNTMMGLDTIEEIDAAYDEIASREARGLVIDLRQNGGGAFAVVPLVAHLISNDFDAGAFISQAWNADHDRAPGESDIAAVQPWTGWSVKAFWADVQTDAVTRISFTPAAPHFAGPVYVLTSSWTASAAELAADALKGSGRATLIGETTAGEMLSQKMYDVPGGLQLSLPIADYYSLAHGRIEGNGVVPDIDVPADEALGVALDRLR